MRELLDAVILLGAAQGAVLAVALARRQNNRLPNRILAALVTALALMMAIGVFEARWALPAHPHLLGFGAPLPFLFAPLLYLYVVALTRPAKRFDPHWLIHFAPFAVDVLFLLQVFYLKSGTEKVALATAPAAGDRAVAARAIDALMLIQAIGYLYASWIALRRYARRIEGYFSDLARIDLQWLTGMVLAHAAVWSIVLVVRVLNAAGFAPPVVHALSKTVQVASALVVFATGYVSLWQPELFETARAAEVTPRPSPKYQRNRLADDEAAALARKLVAQMTDRKIYRDSGLTLQALADAVGATPHMVSQVLNLGIGKSFFVFVNTYRTEALMVALRDPAQRHRGVLELALEAGFNSKSTLNSFFKRHTGLTPSEFRALRTQSKTAAISAS